MNRHPNGSPCFHTAWMRAIRSTYGYDPRSLLAEANGKITGVLPLFLVKNPLTGKALISSPFAVYGGALTDSGESKEALRNSVVELGHSLGVQYVELRNSHPSQRMGFAPVNRYVTFRQAIPGSEEEVLAGIPRKTRRMVRKSLESGFEVRHTRDISRFFDLYSRNLRRLGTPCFPKSHFENLLREFGEKLEVREFWREGEAVAAVMSFLSMGWIYPYYAASAPGSNVHSPNNFMYYEIMCWGSANGFKHFDFGRSKPNTGSHAFKAHWGMTELELPYEMLLVKRKTLPNISPANPKFDLAIRLWRHVPLPVTRLIGPWLNKLVP